MTIATIFRSTALSLLGAACLFGVTATAAAESQRPLLVIGFLGGRVHADNFIHREASMARELQTENPQSMHVLAFANHSGDQALHAVLDYVDANHDGTLSPAEKTSARIVLYGHSWGASQTVTLARQLNTQSIPVLLTVQVDSVQKPGQDDADIPPNVHEAANFYQTEGLLSGRRAIKAEDTAKTTILGNRELSYKTNAVDCHEFPWFARTFMKQHIEIENDPRVWREIQTMIENVAESRPIRPAV